MNTEIGQDVTCAMVILLQGAVSLIEEKMLDRGIDDMMKQQWRKRIFGSSYWITPFGSLQEAKEGLSDRVKDLGGEGIGPELEDFMGWIEALNDRAVVPMEDCRRINSGIFAPALHACARLSDGYLP